MTFLKRRRPFNSLLTCFLVSGIAILLTTQWPSLEQILRADQQQGRFSN